jgi:acetyl esterase/lipase
MEWALGLLVSTAFLQSLSSPAQTKSPVSSTALADGFAKQTFIYKQTGNCPIHTDVYRGPESNRPAIIWIHGGALISGNRGQIQPLQLQKYLAAGFHVISIDYRLAPETKLPSIIEDLQDAFAWVQKQGRALAGIDPQRIGVVGHSAGGYLALMSGVCLRPPPKAIVAFYGYGDIAAAWYSRPDPFYSEKPAVSKEDAYAAVNQGTLSETTAPERSRFYLYCRQQGLWPKEVAGLDPDKEPRAFDPFCPVRNVTRQFPPTLLLHGDKDTDVPYQQSALMAAELKRQGVEHQFITMTNRGHGFDGGRRSADDPLIAETFDRVISFLKTKTNPVKGSE